MDSPSIARAIAQATPNVAELLDRHAKWSAQMCRNVPSREAKMFQNVPSAQAPQVSECSEMCRNVPGSSEMFHRAQSDGTNPPVYTPRQRPLTERQHACARLLVQGYGTMDVAHHLGVEHHTIARWKRNAVFRVELDRLRAQQTAAAVSRPARAARPAAAAYRAPARPPRMTRAEIEREDAECEAMIAQLLRAKGGHT